MKKITQQRSNLRCVFSGKADSLPCETRKENPSFYSQRSVFVVLTINPITFTQLFHCWESSTGAKATPLQWSALGEESVVF